MNMYNTCRSIIIIIVSAIVIAGPLSAKRESYKQQFIRARQQLSQCKQQLTVCTQQLSQTRRQLSQSKKYRLLALGLIKQTMPSYSPKVADTQDTESDDDNDDDDDGDSD